MDSPPKHSASETVIYETHVRGFTIHPSSEVANPGTFAGLTEKIPYLQDLGVTAIELMPAVEFNENESIRLNPLTGEKLKNYWGYNPAAFIAPQQSYSVGGSLPQQTLEFREMVKAFHRAGIGVILDIVLNRTAEGSETGPTVCLRGVENSIFYMLQENGRRADADIKWFAPNGATPDWMDPQQKSLACLILGQSEPDLFLMFNADTRSVNFPIPALPGSKIWRLSVDTSRTAPDDLNEAGKEPSMQGQFRFRVEPRSSAILLTDG
jgi:pullulanase/glycogen debranching enzyme